MDQTKKIVQIECCVCREWRDEAGNWRAPTSEERRNSHYVTHQRISHHYCPACFILEMKRNGLTEDEILKSLSKAR
jgi:hypothetical protein